MKWKEITDFMPVMSQTFFTITHLIDFEKPDNQFILVSNYSVCFSKLKKFFDEAVTNVVNTFIDFYTDIP